MKVEIEFDDSAADLKPEDFLETVVEPAVQAGLDVLERHAIGQLEDNRSIQTGTASSRSATQEAEAAARGELIDSLETETFLDHDNDLCLGVLGPNEDNDDVGTFLEYGHVAIYWGNEITGAVVDADPWLGPALIQGTEEAVEAMAATMANKLESPNKEG